MKNNRSSIPVVFILTTLIISSLMMNCQRECNDLSVVTFTGSGFVDNLSRDYLNFGSLADSGEISALLVSDGDLLYCLGLSESDEMAVIMRYHKEYGNHIAIKTDSLSPGKVWVNDKLQSLMINAEADTSGWLRDITREEMAGLHAIYFTGKLTDGCLSVLKSVADVNPGIGLMLEDVYNQEQFLEILSLFHPSWLFFPDNELDSIPSDLIPNLENLELIILNDLEIQNKDFVYQLPNLKSLTIMDWDPAASNTIHVENIKGLETLGIVESDLKSIGIIGKQENLQALYLVDCEMLTDISHLKSLPDIAQVSLLYCDTLTDLSALNEISSLQWISLPPTINQENFNELIQHHSSLVGIEMIDCENLKDISAITGLPMLKALTIDLPEIDYNTLKQLADIELIIIGQDHFEGSESDIEELKETLPETHIVPGGGFCMGSGWILLVIPFILLVAVIRRIHRK